MADSLNLLLILGWRFRSGLVTGGGGWQVDHGGGAAVVDLGEFVVGAGQADLETFDLAEPSFAFGFGDPGDEVVADIGDSLPLSGVRSVHRAS